MNNIFFKNGVQTYFEEQNTTVLTLHFAFIAVLIYELHTSDAALTGKEIHVIEDKFI